MAAAVRRVDDETVVRVRPAAADGGGLRRARGVLTRSVPRLTGALIVVWGAATLAFLLLHVIPGDPVNIMLGVQSNASEVTRERIRHDLGLDLPIAAQYVAYLGRLASLDLGTSYRLQQPVTTVIGAQLVPTIQLAAASVAVALGIALLIALGARSGPARRVASVGELVAISSPTFWTGLLLLTVFSFQLHWFPISSGLGVEGLVLPAITLALPIAGILSQVIRHGLDGASAQPFVDSARARGLTDVQLLRRHTLRHAALPPVTLAAYIVGSLLGGAVIVEQLFGRPGVGRVTLEAINNRDIPVVMALVVLAAVVFVVVNLIVDLLYPVLDPRLRGHR
jgi:peptide/nickel transport system permease protein